jgi:protein-disulfide isomerase
MFCVISAIVLSILGVFSASNRVLAKEALDCVFRRVTLRPCNTGFDQKMKARILGFVITRSENTARFLNQYFEVLAWGFFVLLLTSGIFALRGFYLFYTTGSCNGLNSTALCVFDPTGKNNETSVIDEGCRVDQAGRGTGLTLKDVDLSGFPVLNSSSPDKIVFIGCYACDYTRKAYPLVKKLVEDTGASFTFLEFPVKEQSDLDARFAYCVNQQDPLAFWDYSDLLFAAEKVDLDNEDFLSDMVTTVGLDNDTIKACVSDPATETGFQNQQQQVLNTNFQGTPTVFINGEALVGPKPYRVYAIRLDGFFYWLNN